MAASRRYVVLGTGLLGWNLVQHLARKGNACVAVGRAELEAAGGFDKAAARHLGAGDVLVNAAAMTNVDACEDDEAAAMRINGDAPGALAVLAQSRGARFVHISTDSVLDVTNVYARSKARGEASIRAAVGDEGALVLRTSTNFGPHPTKGDFVQWVLRTLREKGTFQVLDDMMSSPTYVVDAARAISKLVDAEIVGTQQFVNHPGLSRYAFALRIQAAWALPGEIRPAKMADFTGFRAPRPRDTSMTSTVEAVHPAMDLDACLADYRARLTRAEASGWG